MDNEGERRGRGRPKGSGRIPALEQALEAANEEIARLKVTLAARPDSGAPAGKCAECVALRATIDHLKATVKTLTERPRPQAPTFTDAVGVPASGKVGKASVAGPRAGKAETKAGGAHGQSCQCVFCRGERR